MEINLNADTLNVKTNHMVSLSEYFTLINEKGTPIDLTVTITADFSGIPSEYHEVFLNILTAKYLNKVSFTHNPFSECHLERKKKWYEFWKKENFHKKPFK